MVRRAVRGGLDPIVAIQMATLNPAEYFRLTDVGAVAPGRRADLVVIDDLRDPVVRQVYFGGRLAADAGQVIECGRPAEVPVPPGTMHLSLDRLDFGIPAQSRRMRVIEALAHQIVTGSATAEALIVNDHAVADPAHDLLKIAVVERHRGTGALGLGFIRGFGLKHGALASSVAHDSHNIVVVGVDDSDLRTAVAEVAAMGGGLAVVAQGQALARLPLPIAGLMSDRPVSEVCRQMDALQAAARTLGATLPDPFMTLSFMALPVIPALKMTDQGLVDVASFKHVPLFMI
jgi:adenine deaminase